MAQDIRIVAPDQKRQVTVTNVSQSVALDVNVVSAMFSATVNLAPVVTVTSTLGNPVWVTGSVSAGTLSASVTFPVAVTSTFGLSSSQYTDLTIPPGLQGAAVQWSMGVGTGSVRLSLDNINFVDADQFSVGTSQFARGATTNGLWIVPTIAGAKTMRLFWSGAGQASGTASFTYAPFTGHVSSSGDFAFISGAALITGTVAVTGNVSVILSGTQTVTASINNWPTLLAVSGGLSVAQGSGTVVTQVYTDTQLADTFPPGGLDLGAWVQGGTGFVTTNSGLFIAGDGTHQYTSVITTGSWTKTGGPVGHYDTINAETYALFSASNAGNPISVFGLISGTSAHQNGAYFSFQQGSNTVLAVLKSGSVTVASTGVLAADNSYHRFNVIRSGTSAWIWQVDGVQVFSTAYTALDSVPLKLWFDVSTVVPAAVTASYANLVRTYTSSTTFYPAIADERTYHGYVGTLPASARGATTMSLVDHQAAPLTVDLSGNLKVVVTSGSSVVVSNTASVIIVPTGLGFPTYVAVSGVVQTLLTSNAARKGASVQNGSQDFPVFVCLGATAGQTPVGGLPTPYTVRIRPNGYFEVPYGFYGGITAICSGTDNAIVMVEEYY